MSGIRKLAAATTAVMLAVLAIPAAPVQAQSGLKDIVFTLDFITLGRHSPWYVALAKGYYKEEGLNVKIIPAKGTAHAIQQVESGIA